MHKAQKERERDSKRTAKPGLCVASLGQKSRSFSEISDEEYATLPALLASHPPLHPLRFALSPVSSARATIQLGCGPVRVVQFARNQLS